VEKTIACYTAKLDNSAGQTNPEVMMQDRMAKDRKRLDIALETLDLQCEPVEPPRGEPKDIHSFLGMTTRLASRHL